MHIKRKYSIFTILTLSSTITQRITKKTSTALLILRYSLHHLNITRIQLNFLICTMPNFKLIPR